MRRPKRPGSLGIESEMNYNPNPHDGQMTPYQPSQNLAPAPAPTPPGRPPFIVTEFTPIHRKTLVAQAKAIMPSGLIIRINIIRPKDNPNGIAVFPYTPKNAAGQYEAVLEFANPDVCRAWQRAVMSALEPFAAQLTPPAYSNQGELAVYDF